MKATGEVMAIDRTFGSALNKALRGLEQAGRRAAGRGPRLDADLRLPRRGLRRRPGRTTSRSSWVDEAGQACESTRHAQRTAAPIVLRRFLAPSDSRLWRLLGLLRRGVPEAVIGEATGIAPWFLAEMGRNVALEHEARRDGRAPGGSGRRGGGRAARHGQAGRLRRPRAGRRWPARRSDEIRAARLTPRPRARATRWSTRAPRSSPPRRRTSTRPTPRPGPSPEAPPVARPAALVIGSGPVRIGQGIEFDYCAVQAADTLRRAGWQRGHDQLEPGDRLDRLRRLVAALLRAARPGERAQRHRRRDRPTARTLLPAVVAFGGQTPLNLAAPLAAGGVPLLGSTSRRSTRPRSGRGSRRCSTGSASRSPRAAWRTASRRR